jgi:hypothetical protein
MNQVTGLNIAIFFLFVCGRQGRPRRSMRMRKQAGETSDEKTREKKTHTQKRRALRAMFDASDAAKKGGQKDSKSRQKRMQ